MSRYISVRITRQVAILIALSWLLVALHVNAAQAISSDHTAELLEAAKANDVVAVKKLIDEGASVNTNTGSGDSVLGFACANKNYELARWLIKRGAEIDVTSLYISDKASNLPSFTPAQEGFVAYLLCTQLARGGMVLPYSDPRAQAMFVRRIKQAVIERMKAMGYSFNDSMSWGVRLVKSTYKKEYGEKFVLYCDVAVWTKGLMLEIATKTAALFPVPPSIDTPTLSHAWLEGSEDGPRGVGGTQVLDVNFQPGKVMVGNFVVTGKDPV